MKKLVFLAGFILCFNLMSYSQIVLKDLDNNVISGQTFTPSYDFLHPYYFKVANTSSSEITVKVEVTEIIMASDGGENYAMAFCWGACANLSETGVLGLPARSIAANSEDEEHPDFYISLDGATQQSKVTLKFYEDGNESNFTTITFDSNYSPVAINDIKNNSLNAFPNPAKSNVTFNYSAENTENAFISVYNILGKEVKKVKIENNSGSISVNISDLNSGVYFYNLVIDNQIVNTRKLIINN